MAQDKNAGQTVLYRNRRSFAKIPDVMDVPNLIAIQTDSFKWFMSEGLDQAFQDIAPIENNTKDMCVEFGDHRFGDPKYTVDECKEKDVSYQAPLYVEIRYINRETGEIKEQEVFMGDFPLMTNRGTFIINGTERVVVSQLVRSPGVYFGSERDKASDKTLYNAKVIPSRGAWLEFETDKRDILSVRIDRKRKQPATLLLRALGIAETREEIIELLGDSEMVIRTLDRDPATTKRSRSSSSIVVSVRASRPRSTLRARCSMACSSTRSAMALRRSVATRSTRSSVSTPKTIILRLRRKTSSKRCAISLRSTMVKRVTIPTTSTISAIVASARWAS